MGILAEKGVGENEKLKVLMCTLSTLITRRMLNSFLITPNLFKFGDANFELFFDHGPMIVEKNLNDLKKFASPRSNFGTGLLHFKLCARD
ncbi:hypothetical protein BpHYR1_029403 [Brachionus plicatilis]|uniref:Uncharacterized protein n=1 Tax=Brachionus plicatilis TaxID=10195 RepID=A0A3M7Q8A3_BRAPC|nr:hypothetical protein BpHYR1_029403 [Brachionus plicatilis]